MKTIKIIDLLNMIANGEEMPKKFKYKGETYIYKTYTFDDEEIMTGYGFEDCGWLNIWRNNLNDEVKIIEEDKKIEKLDLQYKDITKGIKFEEQILSYCDNLQYKINEIIDYINKEELNKILEILDKEVN